VSSPRLIRSGWWVLVAAVAVSMMVIVSLIRTPHREPAHAETAPIVLEPCLVDRSDLVRGMQRDGLIALDHPATLTPAEVALINESERGKLLVSSDRVIGVELDGETRAYPLRLLRWHEVVNDSLGRRSIAVTYSPLSGGIAVWDRLLDGDEIELAVSGRLLNSNTLLYDRQPPGGSSSLWHQLTGESIAGPAAGRKLAALPITLATWSDWTRTHPDTTVMAPDESSKSLYKRDPYHSYRGSDVLRFPVDPLPPEGGLALKEFVAIVTTRTGDAVFSLTELARAVGEPSGQWAALLDDEVFMCSFDAEAGTFAIAPRDAGVASPPVRFAYWFEWYSLHPDAVPLP
jgi:hypothetical protein